MHCVLMNYWPSAWPEVSTVCARSCRWRSALPVRPVIVPRQLAKQHETVYTPIVPKRLLDSRGAFIPTCFPGGGAYSNGEIRSFDITTSSCLPTGVSAIVATVYAGPGAVGAISDVYADA